MFLPISIRQNALIARTLCWRLSLATGAGIQARRASAEAQARAKAADSFENLLAISNENLARMKALHQAALDEASRHKLEAEELRSLLARNDDACLELASIRSRHAEEIEAERGQHRETLGRLKKEAEEERKRLGRMLAEVEEELRRRHHDQTAMGESIRWQQAKVKQLSDELSQARNAAESKQSRIRDLEDRVELVKADKIRAQDEAKARAEEMTRLEEEMTRLDLDCQSQVRALQEELLSDRSERAELEGRVGELEEQVVLLQGQVTESEGRAALLQNQLAETETRLAMLKGEQDAICTDAYDLGMEECRSKVSEEHPEWDLSFLDAKSPEVSASEGEDEDEYVDVSDTDDETIPGPSGAEASGGQPRIAAERAKVFEKGEPSHTSTSAVEGSPGVDSVPDL